MATNRTISQIAQEISREWSRPYFGAVPYLQAMYSLGSITDAYGCDSAEEIVTRFLCNASTWRGDAAKRIKTELKALLKQK